MTTPASLTDRIASMQARGSSTPAEWWKVTKPDGSEAEVYFCPPIRQAEVQPTFYPDGATVTPMPKP